MNTKAIAKNYACLTPEERFRLMLAADARGDEAEQQRLHHAGHRLTLSMSDHAPWAHALDELAAMVFLEILAETAKHQDAFRRWCDAEDVWNDESGAGPSLDGREDEGVGGEDGERTQAETDYPGMASSNSDEAGSRPTRTWDLYLAQGFVLKTKLAGWKRFCERWSIPPFAVWQLLPGFERLQKAIPLLEDNAFRPAPAFRPEEMLHWLSQLRSEGEPEPSIEHLLSPERCADDLDQLFRQRVQWWGG
jgi:hypothetical protein